MRAWAKTCLSVCGSHAMMACGDKNLCASLPAGIEGAVHAIERVWNWIDPLLPVQGPPTPMPPPSTPSPATQEFGQPDPVEEEAILMVDASNGFNELNPKAMLWTVRHRWADGARFAFNCYCHSAILLLRRRNQEATVILSQEGVTQGDPLSMVVYGLTLVPLAEIVRCRLPDLIHAWYADNACLTGGIKSEAWPGQGLLHGAQEVGAGLLGLPPRVSAGGPLSIPVPPVERHTVPWRICWCGRRTRHVACGAGGKMAVWR